MLTWPQSSSSQLGGEQIDKIAWPSDQLPDMFLYLYAQEAPKDEASAAPPSAPKTAVELPLLASAREQPLVAFARFSPREVVLLH